MVAINLRFFYCAVGNPSRGALRVRARSLCSDPQRRTVLLQPFPPQSRDSQARDGSGHAERFALPRVLSQAEERMVSRLDRPGMVPKRRTGGQNVDKVDVQEEEHR